ncbi:Acyl-CoA N-acyltransferase [Phytophthora cinnamomi]|uniref:Acyl-CoA N-acyltransferase n=1 Tax=Phytophthora cinnamomi TaxID=4785 RepID=UPI00355A62F6|nr:Acyl-CoA N-acyltransferase [Phytophthora cinnamomi]
MDKFRLVQLTQETLKIQCNVDDFEEWGAPTLDLQQYQRKEELQRATAFSQRGSNFWALVEDNGDSTELVPGQTVLYCHCESHRFDCAVRRSSGEIERGYSHHIGSVFTLPEHRKRGLATFFMKEVAKQLGKLPRALVSVLYSDIGPTYYDKLGWRLHPSKMATLDVAHPHNANSNETEVEIESLFLDDKLDAFFQADNARLVDELSSERFQGGEAFAVLPTRDSLEWQFCIGVHFARVRGYDELPSRCGVKIHENAFVIWCHNLKESTLYVVRARFPEAGDGAAETTRLLLSTALEEARKFKLKKVAIWDPPSGLLHDEVRSHLEIELVERVDSLSSAMVFGHGNSEASTAPLPHWLGNEKYAWV